MNTIVLAMYTTRGQPDVVRTVLLRLSLMAISPELFSKYAEDGYNNVV